MSTVRRSRSSFNGRISAIYAFLTYRAVQALRKSYLGNILFKPVLDYIDLFEKSTRCSKSMTIPMLVSLTGAMCGPNTTIQTKGSVYTSSLNLFNIIIADPGSGKSVAYNKVFQLFLNEISIVLCLNTKYLINKNLDMGIIQHGEFLPMLRYHDMHMALLSVHYGFIPTRVSKSSSSNLHKSATFGDECLYKNTHGNNVICIYLPANTTFYNLMTTLSMRFSQSCTRVYTTTVHNVALS